MYIDYICFRLTLFTFLILKSDGTMIDFYVINIFYDFENYYIFYDLKKKILSRHVLFKTSQILVINQNRFGLGYIFRKWSLPVGGGAEHPVSMHVFRKTKRSSLSTRIKVRYRMNFVY